MSLSTRQLRRLAQVRQQSLLLDRGEAAIDDTIREKIEMAPVSESFMTTVDIPIQMLDSSDTIISVSKTVRSSKGPIFTVELTPGKSHQTNCGLCARISFKHEDISDAQNFNIIAAGSILFKLDGAPVGAKIPFCLSESSESLTQLVTPEDADLISVDISYQKVLKSAFSTFSSTAKNWSALLESGEGADAVLVVDGVDIPVHTLVLSTASPVFKAMFAHETRDKLEKRVVIEDATAEAFKEMLRCAYADCDPEYKNEAFLLEVNALADRYGISGLRSRCVRKLVDTMTETVLSDRVALGLKDNSSISQAFMICMLRKMELSADTKQSLRGHADLSQYF